MQRVLLVDHDADMRSAISEVLRQAGYEVMVVHDGQAALELLKHDANYQVVLADMLLPGMNGLILLAEIKRLYPTLPVIMSSVWDERLWRSKALEAGAVSCLPRPFGINALLAAVRSSRPPAAAAPKC
jgi:DNA-binding response OmpR family regulator